MTDTLSVFFIVMVVSFLFSAILSRIPLIRIPSTAAYLIFGMLLHYKDGLLSSGELLWINHLGEFGLLFLMYISGLEVDIRQLHSNTASQTHKNPLGLALLMFFSTLLLSYGCAVLLSGILPFSYNPYFLALVLSTTSLGVIMPILEEAGLLNSDFGQSLLVSAIFADFFTMLLLSLFVGSHSSTTWLGLLATFTVIPFIVAMYLTLTSLKKFSWLRNLYGDMQMRMRAVMALLGIACLLADFTGAEPILGSFLVGMLVSSISFQYKNTVKEYSYGIGYGFFIPIFFISVGLNYHLSDLESFHSLLWIGLIGLLAFLVKLLPALLLRKQFGTSAAIAGGVLLSARLSLIVAAAKIGVEAKLLSPQFAEYAIVIGVLTSLLAPIAFLNLLPEKFRSRIGN